jgi:hypothetical protein
MNRSQASFQSARGLAHSKTWRSSRRSRALRSVLDYGSPLPLFLPSVMSAIDETFVNPKYLSNR